MRELTQVSLLMLLALCFPLLAGPFVERPVHDCILDNLKLWENAKKKDSFQFVVLPDKIPAPSLGRKDCDRDFNTAVRLLRTTWNPSIIAELRELADAGKNGKLAERDLEAVNARLKEIRAALKTLRFAYEALGLEHEIPPQLDELTIALGKFRDAVQGKRAKPEDIPEGAERLAKALEANKIEKLEREIAAFRPSTRPKFDRWMKDIVRETRKILEGGEDKPKNFHQVRKNLQAILAVYQIELEYHPENREARTVATYLTQVTERLGDRNEEWERADSRGEMDYNGATVKLPKKLSKELLDFLDRIKF